jgi:uncharacterized membrane protein YkoI
MRRVLALAVALPALALPIAAGSGSVDLPTPEQDFERALEAVTRGEIRRLSEILPRIEQEFGGRAIETEIEIETGDGRWIYEFEILTTDGRLFEVDVDAVTGETVDVEEEVD